eukprot:7177376-Prymnesium_polylepis.1
MIRGSCWRAAATPKAHGGWADRPSRMMQGRTCPAYRESKAQQHESRTWPWPCAQTSERARARTRSCVQRTRKPVPRREKGLRSRAATSPSSRRS